jgi:endonuclease/exonuclease/phosphatase family metal-dependent hydrolase
MSTSLLVPVLLTLMSYNIRSGSNVNDVYNLTATAAEINNIHSTVSGPFLVGIQEVDVNTTRHPVNQPELLAQMTGLHSVFARMRDFEGGGYGILILSSVQPLRHRVLHYNGTSPTKCHDQHVADYCQGASAVWFGPPLNIWFVTTHLGLDGVQLEEMRQLVEVEYFLFVKKLERVENVLLQFVKTLDGPVYITGDFNRYLQSYAFLCYHCN